MSTSELIERLEVQLAIAKMMPASRGQSLDAIGIIVELYKLKQRAKP